MFSRTWLLTFGTLGAILIAVCNGIEMNTKTNESEAKAFLNETSAKLFRIMDEATNGKFSPIYNVQIQTIMNEAAAYKKIDREARKFDYNNFKDKDLKFAFKKLLKAVDLKTLKRRRFSELFNASEELQRMLRNENIEDFNGSNNTLYYIPDVKNIIKTSEDLEELEYYWNTWRKSTENWWTNNIDIYLKAFKDAAKINNVSAVEFYFRGYTIDDMEGPMAELKPLYLELHAFIRNQLRQRYGESSIPANGLIPIHLFEQVILQISTNESIIEDIFPIDSLPQLDMALKMFKAEELVRTAERFFENVGFEKYPASVWGDRIKLQIGDLDDEDNEYDDDDKHADVENDDCGSVYGLETPNIRMEYCAKTNFEDFLELHSFMGYLHYSTEMKAAGLPAYFFKPPRDLELAIGDVMILAASSYEYLKEIELIEEYNTSQEVQINRLLRLAIMDILETRLDFVHAKLMADLVSGKIEKSGMNSHYWDLMEKHIGVGPPKGALEDSEYDMPFTFYEKLPENEMTTDFTTSVMSYKIYKRLCELSGEYPKKELHLCNLNRSKKAGDALKTMMQLGSSKPYEQVLATLFPKNQNLDADAFLEYFHPMKKFLTKKNQETKVPIGWKETKSKKN